MIVLKWTVLGFLLTISYKSVLRANLMTTEYDDTIDTIDDMLKSDRQFMVAGDTLLKPLLKSDPRDKVKDLEKRVVYYNAGNKRPEHVSRGYIMLNVTS